MDLPNQGGAGRINSAPRDRLNGFRIKKTTPKRGSSREDQGRGVSWSGWMSGIEGIYFIHRHNWTASH